MFPPQRPISPIVFSTTVLLTLPVLKPTLRVQDNCSGGHRRRRAIETTGQVGVY